MRRLWALLIVAAVTLCACTSSGGSKPPPGKAGAEWFQSRPLVMPGQRASAPRANPFGSLRLPTSETAYNQLSRPDRAALANALRGVDCAHPPKLSSSTDSVACDSGANAFLLGPALFTGNDVTHARVLTPSANVPGWQVALSLSPTAAAAISKWTTRYNAGGVGGSFSDVQTSATPPCGTVITSPCADFIAYVADDKVITTPLSFTKNYGAITLDGQFDQAFTTRLARRLNS